MKAPRVSKVRAAGMNAGGSRSRVSNNVDPVKEKADVIDQGSYLPQQKFAKGGKVRAMSYGKGSKVISCSCGMK